MGFSYSLPVVGQPHSTEDPKVGTALTTLSTWGNGQIADTDLNSPNNSVRRLLLQSQGSFFNAVTVGTWIPCNGGALVTSGASTQQSLPMWVGDAGLSSQPQDFQVANKSAFGRVRVTMVTNAVVSGITWTWGLYPITTAGTAGNITYTLGTVLSGSTAAIASPAASSTIGAESSQFALPTAATAYAFAVVLSGSQAANSGVLMTAQLFGYNA